MKTYWIIQRPDGTLVANTKRRNRRVAIDYFLANNLVFGMAFPLSWLMYTIRGYRCVETSRGLEETAK